MNRLHAATTLFLIAVTMFPLHSSAGDEPFWSQWGRNAQHIGMVNIVGRHAGRVLI